MSTLRDQIKSRRNALGMTQSALARASGVPQPNISDWEAGKTDMVITNADRMIKALGGAALEWPGPAPRKRTKKARPRRAKAIPDSTPPPSTAR